MLVELALRQVDHGLDRRYDAMAARGGQQRRVVAPALVGIAVGKVDDLGPLAAEQGRVGEIVAIGNDLVWCGCLVEVILTAC
jgi:hypothetical protein